MLLKTINFDKQNPYWVDNKGYNLTFLKTNENFINDIIRYQGYVYLNLICERLGVGWNPDDENLCVKSDKKDRIVFIEFELFDQPNNSFLVHILSYE